MDLSDVRTARSVPWRVRLALLTSGKIRQLGWVFVLFGASFSAAFLPFVDLRWRGYDATAEGEVLKVWRTSSTQNDQHIYAVVVAHEAASASTPAPRRYLSRSYTVTPPAVGERVAVEYESANPAEARMRGARTRRFGPVGSLVLLFPLLGLLFALHRARGGLGHLRLLRRGRLTTARVVAVHRGDDDGDGESETLVRLAFRDDEGVERSFEVHTFSPQLLGDDVVERALYDPARPGHATALDTLPGKLEVLDDRVVPRARLWHLQLLPGLSLVALVATAAVLASRLAW